MNLLGRYRTDDSRLSAMTAAVIVVGTGMGLAAVGLWAQPIDVPRARGGYDVILCSRMYQRGSLPVGQVSNNGRSPVEIASIRPTAARAGLRVTDYVAGSEALLATVPIGGQVLPTLARPHTLPPHTTRYIEAMVVGAPNSHTNGFDMVLRNGSTVVTRHLDTRMAFNTSACSGK